MCEDCNDNTAYQNELTAVDFARSIVREVISMRREYASEFSTAEVQKLDEAVENLIDMILTASVRAKTLHDEQQDDKGN